MFDLTVLPYFVFAFMAIPPFIFGYFKGWRSGLFTLGLTLVSGGILIGISVGIYESALWPLFKNLFVQSHNNAGLDVESLKEISKTSVVSIAVGIGLIPMMLIMWGLYLAFKKLLNRYMNPRIKNISKNEVTISRKNLKLTRAGGVLINGTAGLIVASAAAGAVSTLVTPSNKANFFNSMTNVFADGMTFGQGQYNEDYQRMFEFVNTRESGDASVAGFYNTFSMVQAADGKFGDMPALLSQFKTANGYDEFVRETNLMAKDSKEISKALVMMLLNASKTSRDFKLIGFEVGHDDGSHTTAANVKVNEDNIIASLKALSNFADMNSSGFKWNKDGVNEAVKQIFNEKYVDFEKSPYYWDWKNNGDLLAAAKTELQARKDDLSATTTTISSQRAQQQNDVDSFKNQLAISEKAWSDITALVAKIGKSAPDALPVTPDFANAPWNSVWQKITDDGVVMDMGKIISGNHTFKDITTPTTTGSYEEQVNQKNVSDAAKSDYTQKQQTTDISKGVLTNAETEMGVLTRDLGSLQQALKGSQGRLSTAEGVIAAYPAEDKRLNDLLDKEKINNNNLIAKQAQINKEITILTAAATRATQENDVASADLILAVSELKTEKNKSSGLFATLTSAKTAYDKASKELIVKEGVAKTAQDKYKAAVAIYNKEKAEYDAAVAKYNAYTSKAPTIGQSVSSYVKPDPTKMNAAHLKMSASQVNSDTKKNDVATIQAKVDAAQKAVSAAQLPVDNNNAEITRLAIIKSGKETVARVKATAKTKADEDLKDKNRELNTNKADVSTSAAEKTRLARAISTNTNNFQNAKASKATEEGKITNDNKDIAAKNKEIADKQIKIDGFQIDYDDKNKISTAAKNKWVDELNEYKRLNTIYNTDSSTLANLKGQIITYKAKATSLAKSIKNINDDSAGTKGLKANIHHQMVLNNKVPAESDASISYQEQAIKDQDKLLAAALALKDKEKSLHEKRGKELIELVTKILS